MMRKKSFNYWPALMIFAVAIMLISVVLFQDSKIAVEQEIKIPSQSDWTDQGVCISPGREGEWDCRLAGALSPCTVVKKGGTYYLYYIGADGDRSSDGGPRHRSLGVATSTDGINYTKYSGNPVITHRPQNGEEEGVFSAGVTMDGNGDVVLYFGGMEGPGTSVDSDGVLATSTDGKSFTVQGDVLDHSDNSVWGYGDELFPVGVVYADGKWNVYYIAKGHGAMWDLGLARGSSMDSIAGDTREVLDLSSDIISGCDPVWLATDKLGFFIVEDWDTRIVDIRTCSGNTPYSLSSTEKTYDFSSFMHCTVFLDESAGKWYMYYLNTNHEISVKTADVEYVGSTSTLTPDNTQSINRQ